MEYYSMKHVDKLDGRGFEKFTGTFLRALGYEGVKVTKSSGDYGIDVLFFDTHKRRVGIQCKHFSNHNHRTSYRAVEETAGGINCYHLDIGIVATNAQFSPEAISGAKANHIKLWNRNTLDDILKETERENTHSNYGYKIKKRKKKSFTRKRFSKPKKISKKIKFLKRPEYLINLFSRLISNPTSFIRKNPFRKDNNYTYLKNAYCVHYYLTNKRRKGNIKKLSPKVKAWHLKSCLKLMNSVYLLYESPKINSHLVNSIAGSFGVMKKNHLLPYSAKYGHDINNQVHLEHVAYLANLALAKEVKESKIPAYRKNIRRILKSKYPNINGIKRKQTKLNNILNFIRNEANRKSLKKIKKLSIKMLKKRD